MPVDGPPEFPPVVGGPPPVDCNDLVGACSARAVAVAAGTGPCGNGVCAGVGDAVGMTLPIVGVGDRLLLPGVGVVLGRGV